MVVYNQSLTHNITSLAGHQSLNYAYPHQAKQSLF